MTEPSFSQFIDSFVDPDGEYKYQTLKHICGQDPSRKFVVDFHDLYNYDMDMAKQLEDDPKRTLEVFSSEAGVTVYITNLIDVIPIRHIRSNHIGKLIQIHGIVTKTHPSSSKMHKVAFRCVGCDEVMEVVQLTQFLKRPMGQCSCGSRKFEMDFGKTKYIDSQQIYVQESPDQLPPGETPINMRVTLERDIVKSANPGDRVNVAGIIAVYQANPNSPKLELARHLRANYVSVVNHETEMMNLTEREITEIKEFAERSDFFEAIAKNIAPDIHGMTFSKKAIALQLVGNGRLEKKYSTRRGDPHVLLVGDPGIGKTEMLEYAARLSPRGVMTSGAASTKAGLTASTIQDKDGGFVIEAGAMVLADQGICCIDEGEKMRDEDRGAIHPAMEQQKVHIAKGGKVATLNARCAVLMAANPTHGRYEPSLSITENLKSFPVTLLSRFDLIFILRDLPDLDEDRLIARKILGTLTEEAAPLSPDFLKKYFTLAKTYHPVMTDGLLNYFEEYYTKLRKRPAHQNAISITPRQIESLVRLSLAHARLRMSDEATMSDASAVVKLFEKSMTDVGVDPVTGQFDIDLIYSGRPSSMRDKMLQTREIIKSLCKSNLGGDGILEEDLIDWMKEHWKLPYAEAKRIVFNLDGDGVLMHPKPGRIKLA